MKIKPHQINLLGLQRSDTDETSFWIGQQAVYGSHIIVNQIECINNSAQTMKRSTIDLNSQPMAK